MAPPVLSTYMLCGPLPIVSSLGVFVPPKDPAKDSAVSPEHYIHQDSKAWPSHSSISYTFLDGKPLNWQLELVQRAITEYTRYANVNLIRTPKDKDESADIRISFNRDGGAWSAIGADALKIAKDVATMNLGFLSVGFGDSGPQTARDRELIYNLILHQLGHTFGLAHEWQDGWVHVRGNHGNAILEQHIAVFKETEAQGTSNFQEPDEKSIMRFFIPSDYLASGELVGPKGLSVKDKAWLTLIYPGKAAVGADEDTGILHALNVLDIPLDVSSRVLLSPTVSQMRFHYQEHICELWGDVLGAKAVKDAVSALQEKVKQNSSALGELKLEFDVMEGKITGTTPLVDHNYEDDLYDSVAAAVLDPQFSAILANAINQDNDGQPGVQNFVNFNPPVQNYYMSGINPQASPDVQRFIGPLLTSLVPALLPMLGKLIFSALPPDAMSGSGIYSHGLPPNVEQGIFSSVTKFLKHPTFLAIVRDIASDMIDRNDQSESNSEE